MSRIEPGEACLAQGLVRFSRENPRSCPDVHPIGCHNSHPSTPFAEHPLGAHPDLTSDHFQPERWVAVCPLVDDLQAGLPEEWPVNDHSEAHDQVGSRPSSPVFARHLLAGWEKQCDAVARLTHYLAPTSPCLRPSQHAWPIRFVYCPTESVLFAFWPATWGRFVPFNHADFVAWIFLG